jgi:hypothetical protein
MAANKSSPPPKKNTKLHWDQNMAFVVGLAYQGKDIIFRFIIEYSSLRDFYRPLGNNPIVA